MSKYWQEQTLELTPSIDCNTLILQGNKTRDLVIIFVPAFTHVEWRMQDKEQMKEINTETESEGRKVDIYALSLDLFNNLDAKYIFIFMAYVIILLCVCVVVLYTLQKHKQ